MSAAWVERLDVVYLCPRGASQRDHPNHYPAKGGRCWCWRRCGICGSWFDANPDPHDGGAPDNCRSCERAVEAWDESMQAWLDWRERVGT